jgi:DNA-binding response OmpR family regulator
VLVVEDDADISLLVKTLLLRQGYVVDIAPNTTIATALTTSFTYDLIICDVRLPEGENAGFEFVMGLRRQAILSPVLFLTARATPTDRVTGLDAGGDDYLIKPFDLDELLARLRALTRRTRASPQSTFEYKTLSVNWNSKKVFIENKEIHLTAKEYFLLELLVSQPGRVYTQTEISERVWGNETESETNVIGVNISTLRHKLGDWVIETIRGVGYRFPSIEA